MFKREDYWPYVAGVFVFAGLLGLPLVWSLFVDLPIPRLVAFSCVASGIFAYAHSREGQFLVGRFLVATAFVFLLTMRAIGQAGEGVVVLPGGIVGILIMVAGGWLGILFARVSGITDQIRVELAAEEARALERANLSAQSQPPPVADVVDPPTAAATEGATATPGTAVAAPARPLRLGRWLKLAALAILLFAVITAAIDDYDWPKDETTLFQSAGTYSRTATAPREFSILRPWGLVRPTLGEVWYVNQQIVHIDDELLLIELARRSRTSYRTQPMLIDLAGERCADVAQQGSFGARDMDYPRAAAADWRPCGDASLMRDTLQYLRTTYARSVAEARSFSMRLRQRVATRPTVDDINLVSFVLTQVNAQTPDLSGRLQLLCGLLSKAEASGEVFLGLQERSEGMRLDEPYFDTIAYQSGRVPLTRKAGCVEITRYSLRWTETATSGPPNQFNEAGSDRVVFLHDASAKGLLEVRDRDAVIFEKTLVASDGWPMFVESAQLGEWYKDEQDRVHYTKEDVVRGLLREQANGLALPVLGTPAAPLQTGRDATSRPVQATFCYGLASIAAGYYFRGLSVIRKLVADAEPADALYLRRAMAYFGDEAASATTSSDASSGYAPVCPPIAGIYMGP